MNTSPNAHATQLAALTLIASLCGADGPGSHDQRRHTHGDGYHNNLLDLDC
jgi:hypothetical protein